MRGQKELNPDPKAIQQLEFVGQLKNTYGCKCCWHTIYVCFNDFRKSQRNETKIFWRKHNSLIKDDELWRSES